VKNEKTLIHKSAEVHSTNIGEGTRIWQNCVVLPSAVIGANCNICAFCFIENDVIIGNDVTVKNNISIWDGARIENNVFLGPGVVFTNDLRPRSKQGYKTGNIVVKEGASIGAGTTILAGTTIGKYVMTGIGSVITKDVPDYGLVYGNPAKLQGFVDEQGNKLQHIGNNKWRFPDGRMLDNLHLNSHND